MSSRSQFVATNFSSIKDAIEAMQPGDELWIPPGTYLLNEPIAVDRPNMSIVGEGGETRLVVQNDAQAAFRVSAPGFELRNVQIDSAAAARPESEKE